MALTAKKVYAILKHQISDMEAKLNSPVRYRGTVSTADLLPLNPDIGDMYNIESKSIYGEAGMNVAWNGVTWDTMGAPIDMSLYLTKEGATTTIQNMVNEYLEKNPVLPGATTEQAQQIEQNKADVAALKEETGSLKEDLGNVENDVSTLSQGDIPIKLIADKFLTSLGIADYIGWSATENIKVEGLDYIYTEWSKASSYNKFLDSSFGLVKMVTIKDGLQKTNVPEGSCYVAFSNETTVMEGLRVWSPTKINSYENTLEISKLKQDIPFYYEKHLTDKITEVRAKETFSGVNGDEFIFITDYHMERNANNSPSLIDKIIHQTGAKKIVFGGDAYDASSTPDLALNKIADFYSMFYENADKILSCV